MWHSNQPKTKLSSHAMPATLLEVCLQIWRSRSQVSSFTYYCPHGEEGVNHSEGCIVIQVYSILRCKTLFCSSLNFPWTTVSFHKPEDFFIPGDKEVINNRSCLDWLTVQMEVYADGLDYATRGIRSMEICLLISNCFYCLEVERMVIVVASA